MSMLQAGDSVSRGCLNTPHEISTCTNNNQQCSFCSVNSNSSACNTFEFPAGRRQCHFTRGANASSLSTTPSKYCTHASDTCMLIKSDGKLSQICSREMNSAEITFCDSHHECCSTCSTNNCNTQAPSYACTTKTNNGANNLHNPLLISVIVLLSVTVLMTRLRLFAY